LLAGNNLLRIEQRPAARGRTRHVYIMQYPPYTPGESDSGQWIRLDREIVMQGVWAAMRPATRRLYLVLRAHCLRQEHADGERWVDPGDLEGVQAEGAFLPAQFMSQDFLMQHTGLAPRTIRDSRQWLLDSGLAYPTPCSQVPGLILPFSPGCHAPKVLHALQASQEQAPSQENGAASGYITRTLRGMRRQQRKTGAKRAGKLQQIKSI